MSKPGERRTDKAAACDCFLDPEGVDLTYLPCQRIEGAHDVAKTYRLSAYSKTSSVTMTVARWK